MQFSHDAMRDAVRTLFLANGGALIALLAYQGTGTGRAGTQLAKSLMTHGGVAILVGIIMTSATAILYAVLQNQADFERRLTVTTHKFLRTMLWLSLGFFALGAALVCVGVIV